MSPAACWSSWWKRRVRSQERSCRELLEALLCSAFLELFVQILLRFQQDGSNSSQGDCVYRAAPQEERCPCASLTAGTSPLLSPLRARTAFLHCEQPGKASAPSTSPGCCGGDNVHKSLSAHSGALWSCCPGQSCSRSDSALTTLLPSSEDVQAEQMACDPRPITAGNLD